MQQPSSLQALTVENSLLLESRRPSWTPSLPETAGKQSRTRSVTGIKSSESLPAHIELSSHMDQVQNSVPSSPEDGGNFRKSLQIDMKGLVGDAVGNMSISPASRDVVLAARRGLFIIDLEAPLEVPRFLPQGGTWDVADVQWNPHASRAEYIVSTSSEKLLIWNLLLPSHSSIQHVLHSHYRAITDINWHTTERDVVVSTGIDAWLWAWDLRETRRPVFGLSAFNSGGTQVKWNRHDPHILASSHSNEVLIWDRRKGSMPIVRIQAHTSKIYGIDWSHTLANEIITCSLDRSIKVWDVQNSLQDSNPPAEKGCEPDLTIRTSYPVWRARSLPFGEGMLSLAQRGEATLEMYPRTRQGVVPPGREPIPPLPVEVFEGHTDVVKEFVWRKGGQEGSEFQLITWSKDRTLRFWPVDTDVMERVGHLDRHPLGTFAQNKTEKEASFSFRKPKNVADTLPQLSAPIGHRSILAEVRAAHPTRNPQQYPVIPYPPVNLPQLKTPFHYPLSNAEKSPTSSRTQPMRMPPLKKTATSTMSRGTGGGGKSVSKRGNVDALDWLASVKVSETRRESSSGHGSGSRPGSGSRAVSGNDIAGLDGEVSFTAGRRKRSESRSRGSEDKKDGEAAQSLQDEITSVLKKLSSSKIKLEKHDLMKKRTCTLGLHGPWGEASSVFMRMTFAFPRDYPHGNGIPTVELERNPLISIKDRTFILRRLRTIRETKRPCLESCLRFLLFASEEDEQPIDALDSEESSSEDDESIPTKKTRESAFATLRNNKNITEPRTSQGCFGPNGELVCFFRAPPRIIRHVSQQKDDSGSQSPPMTLSATPRNLPTNAPPVYQSPSLITDAIRRLSLAASDRTSRPTDRERLQGDNMLRIMTNLLTFSQSRLKSTSGMNTRNYSLVAPSQMTVFLHDTIEYGGPDKTVAEEYIFTSSTLAGLCMANADIAQSHGRYDHERVFRTLSAVFPPSTGPGSNLWWASEAPMTLVKTLLLRLFQKFRQDKDVQMLAMICVIILQAAHLSVLERDPSTLGTPRTVSAATPKFTGLDYFSLPPTRDATLSPTSPIWTRLGSPVLPAVSSSISSSTSSRASWSSLFNTGSVRQFMSGVQDTLREGLVTPLETPTPVSARGVAGVPFPLNTRLAALGRGPSTPGLSPRARKWVGSPGIPPVVSKSWNDTVPITPRRHTFSSAVTGPTPIRERGPKDKDKHKALTFEEPEVIEKRSPPMFSDNELAEFVSHIQCYAEVLFRWQLFNKRLELLKSIHHVDAESSQHQIGVILRCSRCAMSLPRAVNACPSCGFPCGLPPCSVCRIPVKGLSQSCMRCLHIAHIACWKKMKLFVCASGCGCNCIGFQAAFSNAGAPGSLKSPLMSGA